MGGVAPDKCLTRNDREHRSYRVDPDNPSLTAQAVCIVEGIDPATGLPTSKINQIVGRESMSLSSSSISTLTIPAGTTGAKIQVIGGEAYMTFEGTDPLSDGSLGDHYCAGDHLFLGSEDNDTTWSLDEITNLKAISPLGASTRLEINYYKKG